MPLVTDRTSTLGGWLAVASGAVMIVASLLRGTVSETVTLADADHRRRNGFQVGPHATSTVSGSVTVALGCATLGLGAAHRSRAVRSIWLARPPLWPGIGCAILLAASLPSVNHLIFTQPGVSIHSWRGDRPFALGAGAVGAGLASVFGLPRAGSTAGQRPRHRPPEAGGT